MKIEDLIENWKAGNMPASIKNDITLSEGYRAYWNLKQEMWKRTKFNPLNNLNYDGKSKTFCYVAEYL